MCSWPSGLRRCIKAAVSSEAWVRIPSNTIIFFSFFFKEKISLKKHKIKISQMREKITTIFFPPSSSVVSIEFTFVICLCRFYISFFINYHYYPNHCHQNHNHNNHQKTMEGKLAEILKSSEGASSPEDIEKFTKESKDFLGLFNRYLRIIKEQSPYVNWTDVSAPPAEHVLDYSALPAPATERIGELLSKLVIVKLNGGLGTTMGCTGPKSLIEAHGGRTFLDLIVEQIRYLNAAYKTSVPLVLMDSFNTHKDTIAALSKYAKSGVRIETFQQSQHPRFYADTLEPVARALGGPNSEWYPPGHADIYPSLVNSGLLEGFLAEGKEYLFVSNSDNLGATIDLSILSYLAASGAGFVMEVTPKTLADVKGGTLIWNTAEQKIKLLELAQVPPEHIKDFESIDVFKIFNTNNLWVRLDRVAPLVASGKLADEMDVIVNRKQLDGRTVIQLEIAAGAAIQFFDNARGVCVPRSRFVPVKTTNDLFLLESNIFTAEHGIVRRNAQLRSEDEPLPIIQLGPEFKTVEGFEKHLPAGIPDISKLRSLKISGDVVFGKNVVLVGDVSISVAQGSSLNIPDGTVIENKSVVDHL